jgi:hypothetical protein
MRNILKAAIAVVAAFAATPALVRAWDYPGHRIVNQLALQSLPPDFPAFVHDPENAERIAFLAGEPDRWRNSPDLPLQHDNGLDHYIDLEQLADAGLDPATLSPFRYEFAAQFAAARAAHPDRFPPIDPAKNLDLSREWPGFLPWAITEGYSRLKSSFSYLKEYERAGMPEEVANAKANVVYLMGVLGHYVGDGSQPLHTTVHHHGWVGPNPNGYTTRFSIHAWIDGGFIAKAGISLAEVEPGLVSATPLDLAPRADGQNPVFGDVLDYLYAQNRQVEPLYRLEKDGMFRADGSPGSLDGRTFIDAQLLQGAQMLGSVWLTAWRQAGPDMYLRAQLAKRAPENRVP